MLTPLRNPTSLLPTDSQKLTTNDKQGTFLDPDFFKPLTTEADHIYIYPTEFYEAFSQNSSSSQNNELAMLVLGYMTLHDKARLPLFDGASDRYVKLVTPAIQEMLATGNEDHDTLTIKFHIMNCASQLGYLKHPALFLNGIVMLRRVNLLGMDLRNACLAKANLHGAFLSEVNLHGADLSQADLSGSQLIRANLAMANISQANLSDTDLRGADLSEAHLSAADLGGADLRRADLRRADLRKANLRKADLRRADLRWSDLSEADLSFANLHQANLRSTKLRGANLSKTDLSFQDLSEIQISDTD